jgi:Ca-activated chloride channel homolog
MIAREQAVAVSVLSWLAVATVGGGDRQVFKAGVELVQVSATVTDGMGRLVTGLGREDLVVSEDGIEQHVTLFSSERMPASLGILVDISDSMLGRRLGDASHAVDRFLLDLLDPGDEAFLLVFNHEPRVLARWTSPPRGLGHRLDDAKAFGGTAIYDALLATVPLLGARRHQRCGLVVISDGADTASDHSLQDVLRAFVGTDAFVYALAIDDPAGAAIASRFSPETLNEIAGQGGGYVEVIRQSSDLLGATERIATELNNQYTLAYLPPHPGDGKYHSIRVRARNDEYKVRARRGYIATPRSRPGS